MPYHSHVPYARHDYYGWTEWHVSIQYWYVSLLIGRDLYTLTSAYIYTCILAYDCNLSALITLHLTCHPIVHVMRLPG